MRPSIAFRPPLATVALAAAALLGPGAARALEYVQADASANDATLVLIQQIGEPAAGRPTPLVVAGYSQWDTGRSMGLGYVHRWALAGEEHRWTLGLGLGVNDFRSRDGNATDDQTAASARAQLEVDGPVLGGRYYALIQGSTFRGSALAVAQVTPAGWPVGLEWSRYDERDYQSTQLGLRIATGIARWSVRVGANRAEGQTKAYLGVAYNGF